MVYFDGLNTEEHERTVGTGSNEPLPVNFYEFVITRNVIKKNGDKAKDPNGKYIEVEFDVVSPAAFNRRKYWEKFNIINKSQDATRIGKEHLSDLLVQAGIMSLPAGEMEDSNPIPALNGRSVCGYLVIEKGTNGYSDSNKCLKYLPSGSSIDDYNNWYASKKGGKPSGAVEKKGWGTQPAQAVASSQAEPKKTAPWKKN